MSDESTTPKPDDTAGPAPAGGEPRIEDAPVEPANVEPAAGESVTVEPANVEPANVEPAAGESATVEPATATPAAAEPPTAPEPVAPVTPTSSLPAPAGREVVYVEAPVPPRIRGNRIVGVLLAIVGAIVFAVLYAVVSGVLLFLQGHPFFGPSWQRLIASDGYWVPVLIFVLAFILLVVIVNRGGWAAHVFGSLLLAFVVYFASIGLVLVVSNLVQGGHQTFSQVATFTPIIAAAVLSREVSIWIGLAIAARGRRVRARNAEARAAYDRELSEKRAQYERPVAAPAD